MVVATLAKPVGIALLLAGAPPVARRTPACVSCEPPLERAEQMEQTLAALDAVEPKMGNEMYTTAKKLAAEEMRREGMQEIKGPFEIAELPGAARAFGWASEALYGGRLAASQVALLSGWAGSAAALGTALLIVIPLLTVSPVASVAHVLTGPLTAACGALSYFADQAVLVLSALALSLAALVQSIASGAPMGLASALNRGPQLMFMFINQLKRRPALGMTYAVRALANMLPRCLDQRVA